ncbi:MAG: thioredoxin family protein [Litoreibacter sp.]|uniref:thioredoxin family protein n=1 Tax=Litoreibacter sp. TaxID=1969459 RepID=UPI00329757AC
MKKQNRKPKGKKSKNAEQNAPQPAKRSRRDFLKLARNGAIALPVLGAVGYFSVRSVQATIGEGDFSKIGNGSLSVVQIHDPQCPLCKTLQNQTRRALKDFRQGKFNFLVANIKSPSGAEFAAKYGVPHVTLLLFDRDGEMVRVVRGPIGDDQLQQALAAHEDAHG